MFCKCKQNKLLRVKSFSLCWSDSKNPAYGIQRISWQMRTVGPIQFWRGCVIYLRNTSPFLGLYLRPPIRIEKWTRSTQKCGLGPRSGGGGHPENIPVFRALLETTDPHQKTDSFHAKMQTRFTPEHIPVFRALLEIEIKIKGGGLTNERPGSDHVTWGPMRGLK